MTTETPQSALAAKPAPGFKLSFIFLFLMGALFTWLIIQATGYGSPSAGFVCLGAITPPLLNVILNVVRRRPLRVWGQLLLLLLVLGVVAVVAPLTTRISPEEFTHRVFGVPPPPGFKLISARQQFFDGWIIIGEFDADDATIEKLVAYRPIPLNKKIDPQNAEEWPSSWRLEFNLVPIVDRSWRTPPQIQSGVLYEYPPEGKPLRPDPEFVRLLYDPEAHKAWVVYNQM